MSVSMLGSHMWKLYLSFKSYVVWTFLLHHSSYDLYPWYGTLSELGIAEEARCTLMNSRAEFRQGSVPSIEIVRGMVK